MSRQNNNNNRKGRRINRRQPNMSSAIPNQIYAATLPREQKVKLNYFELRSFTLTASIANDYLWNLNSIFDPNRTSTGHQPQGYDLWAAFYNRYRVDKTKVTFTVAYTGSASMILTLLANNDGTAINDPSVLAESPLSTTRLHSTNGNPSTITRTFDLAVLNGVSRAVYNTDDRYQAQIGSSPTEVLVAHTAVCDPGLTAVACNYTVLIEYYVTLFDPIQQPLS